MYEQGSPGKLQFFYCYYYWYYIFFSFFGEEGAFGEAKMTHRNKGKIMKKNEQKKEKVKYKSINH